MALQDGARSAGATVEAIIKQEYAAYQVSAAESIAVADVRKTAEIAVALMMGA